MTLSLLHVVFPTSRLCGSSDEAVGTETSMEEKRKDEGKASGSQLDATLQPFRRLLVRPQKALLA